MKMNTIPETVSKQGMNDAEKMAEIANNYKPRPPRKSFSCRIEEYSKKSKLAKQKKYCFRVIKKVAQKGEKTAYVFSADEELRHPPIIVGPIMFGGGARKDYLRMKETDLGDFIQELEEKGYKVEVHEVNKKLGKAKKNSDLKTYLEFLGDKRRPAAEKFSRYLLTQKSTRVKLLVIKF